MAAYALTKHRYQGGRLHQIVYHCKTNHKLHMLYVALSWVTSLKSLFLPTTHRCSLAVDIKRLQGAASADNDIRCFNIIKEYVNAQSWSAPTPTDSLMLANLPAINDLYEFCTSVIINKLQLVHQIPTNSALVVGRL